MKSFTMNKTLTALLGALLLTGGANAFAASVDLSVTGKITPSACTPSLAQGGRVDFGKISAKDLNTDQSTSLPPQTLQLKLTCDGATLAALEGKDNRAGSNSNNDDGDFGLGLINDSEKLGFVRLRPLLLMADGVAGRLIASYNNGASWGDQNFLMRDNIVSVADFGSLSPKPFVELSSNLQIEPTIAPAKDLTLTNEVAIDGSVTLTVHYL